MCERATSMTILCLSHLLWCPDPDTYDTIFVIASYGFIISVAIFCVNPLSLTKSQEPYIIEDDGDEKIFFSHDGKLDQATGAVEG